MKKKEVRKLKKLNNFKFFADFVGIYDFIEELNEEGFIVSDDQTNYLKREDIKGVSYDDGKYKRFFCTECNQLGLLDNSSTSRCPKCSARLLEYGNNIFKHLNNIIGYKVIDNKVYVKVLEMYKYEEDGKSYLTYSKIETPVITITEDTFVRHFKNQTILGLNSTYDVYGNTNHNLANLLCENLDFLCINNNFKKNKDHLKEMFYRTKTLTFLDYIAEDKIDVKGLKNNYYFKNFVYVNGMNAVKKYFNISDDEYINEDKIFKKYEELFGYDYTKRVIMNEKIMLKYKNFFKSIDNVEEDNKEFKTMLELFEKVNKDYGDKLIDLICEYDYALEYFPRIFKRNLHKARTFYGFDNEGFIKLFMDYVETDLKYYEELIGSFDRDLLSGLINKLNVLQKLNIEPSLENLTHKNFNKILNTLQLKDSYNLPKEKAIAFNNFMDIDPLKAYSFIANRRALTKEEVEEISKIVN